jgi:hypothetical protein
MRIVMPHGPEGAPAPSRTRGGHTPARPAGGPRRAEHPAILELQRLAGNAATSRWLQAQRDPSPEAKAADPEQAWEGSLKTSLGEKGMLYHTLNNFGDRPFEYLLRVQNTGYAMVTLGTQFESLRESKAGRDERMPIGDLKRQTGRRSPFSDLGGGGSRQVEREWFAFGVQRGKTEQATYGLPPRSSLHLRLFGERDYTDPNQSHVEGTLQVRRVK